MDRTAEAGKIKGGGVCFMINKKWCDPRNISILSRSCSPHLEHLSIICRPFYLPREFSAVIATAVYIPPQADTSLALSKLHEEISGYINKHPDAASIVAGDFKKANLRKVMPTFHQHVSCPTRGPNTLDHFYTQFKNAYKARSLPAFGKSDHAAIFLTPEYKQRIVQESPGKREVTRWSSHSEVMLQASLDDVDWDMFRASSADVSEFTDVALSFVYMLTDQATETVTIRTFSNQKPWVDRTIRAAVNQRTAAYNAGLLSGNMSDYKASCYALRRAVRAAKLRYRERIESHFQLNDSRRMWQGLKTICSSGNKSSAEVRADPLLAEELNTFYGHFECNGGATLPISTSARGSSAGSPRVRWPRCPHARRSREIYAAGGGYPKPAGGLPSSRVAAPPGAPFVGDHATGPPLTQCPPDRRWLKPAGSTLSPSPVDPVHNTARSAVCMSGLCPQGHFNYLVGHVHRDSSGAGGSSCCGHGGHSSRLPPCRRSGSGCWGTLWGPLTPRHAQRKPQLPSQPRRASCSCGLSCPVCLAPEGFPVLSCTVLCVQPRRVPDTP